MSIHAYFSHYKMEEMGEILELKKDERLRMENEQQKVYVRNQIMDNSLSTLKHETMYYPHRIKQIVDAARQMQEQYGVELVIPYGTAVENLRLTEYNDEYSLCRDNLHLGLGLARYTAAAAYYEALVAPRSGIDIEGNAYRYACSRGDWDLSSKSKPVNVTDKNVRIAWKAAAEACRSWDKLITW